MGNQICSRGRGSYPEQEEIAKQMQERLSLIQLTEKEMIILTDIIKAASAATEKYKIPIPQSNNLGEKEVRSIKPVLDLFQLVDNGKADAIGRVTGEDGSAVIAAYKLPGEGKTYNSDDVYGFKYRMQVFLKEIAASGRIRPRILYIADCHFYHDNICHRMDKRGFSGSEEMNEVMIRQWNAKVTSKDDVYIIGDFCISRDDAVNRILCRLNGKLHLIIGNHDSYLEDRRFDRSWFKSIDDYKEIHDNGRMVILSHYPIFCYKGQYRRNQDGSPKTYMLYGHVHNTQDEMLVNRFIMETRNTKVMSRHSAEPEPIPCNMINCFCMFSNYQPMTLDEWIVVDEKRRQQIS